jgi:hypothetical protein
LENEDECADANFTNGAARKYVRCCLDCRVELVDGGRNGSSRSHLRGRSGGWGKLII